MGPTEGIKEEESLENRYARMIDELVSRNNWTPRKARRYLDSVSKKQVRKTMKIGKRLPKVDVSDIVI